MGVSNSSGNYKTFYKLKEEKSDASPHKGELRFCKKEKIDGTWKETEQFNSLSGYLQKLNIHTYQHQGEDKEELEIHFKDDSGPDEFVAHLGFDTLIAKSILNTFAGIDKFGVISMNCGKAKQAEGNPGKTFPTLYINNNGEKTSWKFRKEDVPQITIEKIENQTIKRGVTANLEFWRNVLVSINQRIEPAANIINGPSHEVPDEFTAARNNFDMNTGGNQYQNNNAGFNPNNPPYTPENVDDLPF